MGFGRAERIFHLGGNFGNSSSSGCKSGSRFCFLAGKLEMRPRVALLGSQSRHNKTIKSEIHPTLWSVSLRMYIWFGFHFKVDQYRSMTLLLVKQGTPLLVEPNPKSNTALYESTAFRDSHLAVPLISFSSDELNGLCESVISQLGGWEMPPNTF